MREIKFRAWDELQGKYCYATLDGLCVAIVSDYKDPVFDFSCAGRCYEKYEQFTGLLDKNGTEIYEGDILLCDAENFRGDVEFCFGAFSTTARGFGMEHLHDANDICEVIGNIHENPELLESP